MKRMNSMILTALLGVLVLVTCVSSASATSEWTMDLSAEMEGITADLTYGVDSSATDGYDTGLDTNAPLADPSGFDAYFNEPGVGTGKLNTDIKALGTIKDWTLMAVAPATKTVDVSWTSGDILANVDMQMQEIDPSTGNLTGPIIDMKTQEQITFDGGAYIAETKIYKITATTNETTAPPELVSCVIDPTPPVMQGTNITVDCLFSETVAYEIRIENATTGDLVEEIGSGTAKNPDPKWWNTTTETPVGIYTVNVTMDNSTSGLSSYNNTNTIEVTAESVMNTYYGDADGDGYGDPANTTEAYSAPDGYVIDNTDCDDTNAAVNPGATEVCNGIDDNCDGQIDEGCATSEWTMDLSAEMEGITADLTYGVDSSATDGYDTGLDTNAPLADPSGFDAYFNEPGVGTGKLNTDIKALGTIKDWTLMAVAPATKTVDVSWTSGDILANVDMQMQEIDPSTGNLTGPIIDMKTQEQITFDGGAYIAETKIYKITATTNETTAPPELVSCVIDPTPPVMQGTNITVDCLFSETVAYEIRIENATTGDLVEEIGSGTAKNPDPKWWNTTTETPVGTYTVNVTMDNSTSGMSVYNNTNTIEVTPEDGDTTAPVIADVACDTPTTDSVNITWTTDEDSDSLVKYGTETGVYTDNESDATMVTSHSITLTGLDANTTYYFVVNSTDASGNPAESAEGNFTTAAAQDTTAPVIADVACDTPTTDSVNITWTTDEDSDSLVKYGTETGVYTDNESDATMVTSHSITLTGLDANTTYYFVVNSTDASGNPAESAEGNFTTAAAQDTTAPVIADVACDTPTTDSVNITWTTDEDSDSLVKYGTETGVYTDNESDATMVTSHSITLTGLDANTTYYFVVNSTDASGNPAESAEGNFTTAAAQDTTAPVIADVACDTPTTDSVNITWTTDEDSDSLVKYGTETGVYTDNESDATMVTSHSITLTGLDANTTYYFVVNSTDASGNPAESAEGNFTTAAAQDTTAPVIADVACDTPTTDSVNITWTTDEDSDSLVKYGTETGVYTDNESDATMVTSHSITLTGLDANTTYYFVVNSTDASGNPAESAEGNFTTAAAQDTTAPVIADVACDTPTTDSVNITWTTDEDSDSLVKYGTETGVYTDNESDATMVTSHSITLTGLDANTTYYFVVNSTDASGNPAESAEGNFTTAAAQDTTAPVIADVACDTPTTDSVNITWTTDEDSDSLVKYGTETGVYTDNESDATMVTSHSITLTGLDANTTYYFVVNSTDASGNPAESAEGNFTTAAAQDTTAPVIADVACDTPTTDSVNITWTTDEDSDSLVKYGTETGVYTDNESDATMVTSHSITLTGLDANTTYYFVVNSTDASGNPAESAEGNFTTAAASIVEITDWTLDAIGTCGTSIDAAVNITNTGTETLWFVVSVSGAETTTGYPLVGTGTVRLAAGDSINVPLKIVVPGSADTGDYTLIPVVYKLDDYPAGNPEAVGSGESVTIS